MLDGKAMQRLPEKGINSAARAGMKLGYLWRGEMDRGESMVRDHLLRRAMIQSGEYKQIAADIKSSSAEDDLESLDLFLKWSGSSRATYDRNEKAISALSPEIVQALRTIGLPLKDIRILCETPDGVKREMKPLTDGRAHTQEALDEVRCRIIDMAEKLAAEKVAREKAERAKASADERSTKLADKLVAREDDLKDAQAELRIMRERPAMTSKAIQDCLTDARNKVMMAVSTLSRLEPEWKKNEEVAALVNKCLLDILGPCSRMKQECLKAMHFGQD
jgi:chromosome segregation ATPase